MMKNRMRNDIDDDFDQIPEVAVSLVASNTGSIFSSSSSASASAAGVVTTGAKIRLAAMKKEKKNQVKKEEGIDSIRIRGRNDNNNNNNHELKIKKEEDIIKNEDNSKDHNNDVSSDLVERNRNNTNTVDHDYDCNYADWKKGNWCWLPHLSLPTNNNNNDAENNTNDNNITSSIKTSTKATRNSRLLNRFNGDGDGDKKGYGNNKNNNDNGNDKFSNVPPKKKLKHSNNSDHTMGIIKRESMSNGNNYNDNDVGYESWTEGNWCWIITPSSSSSSHDIDFSTFKQKTRSHNDYNETEEGKIHKTNNDDDYNDDYNDDDDDDDDDDYNEKEENVEYTLIPNGKNIKEINVNVEVEDDDDDDDTDNDNNDDVGYESWTEGNWCLLLPNTNNSSTPNTTKNRTTQTINVRRRYRCTVRSIQENKRWNKMFQRLVAYKEKHQTTNVPDQSKEDPQLGSWVTRKRKNYRKEILSKYRMVRLNSIGFVWGNIHVARWMEMYQKLIVYKNQHKSTSVPRDYKEDPQLRYWVNAQRTAYKNKLLSVQRTYYLESIGFVWKFRDLIPWIEMYERLVVYKQQHQSTNVPNFYSEAPYLGRWVGYQRSQYSKRELSEKRMELLNSINFVWSIRNNDTSQK